MPDRAKVAVAIMRHLVTHDGDNGHGYTQGGARWGNQKKEHVIVDGLKYEFMGGDRDCSSAVISAWTAAGVDCGGATYTGDMISCMCSTGNFELKTPSFIASPGDIYLNVQNHAAMCLTQTPDQLMEFCIDENGNIIGGKVGDQTGAESRIANWYDFPWDYIIHYTGKVDGKDCGSWVQDAKGWWYRYPDGSYPKNQWLELDTWYWFDPDGYAAKFSWRKIGGKWYFFGADCRMWSSCVVHWGNEDYVLSRTGAMEEGSVPLNPNGSIAY